MTTSRNRGLGPAPEPQIPPVLPATIVASDGSTATVEVSVYPGIALGPYPLIAGLPAATTSVGDHGSHTHTRTAPVAGSACVLLSVDLATAWVLPVDGVS